MLMEYEHITHSFKPVYDENSRILILGTLPSVKSRENNFYYGHKQNRTVSGSCLRIYWMNRCRRR